MQAITTEKLKSLREKGDNLLIVNTLDPEQFDKSKIPGAVNIPQSQANFAQNVEKKLSDKSKPVVVYCASKECQSSTEAAKKLDDAGFTKVFDYVGGAKAWQSEAKSTATR